MNGCQIIETFNKLLDRFRYSEFVDGAFDHCRGRKFGGVYIIGAGSHDTVGHYEHLLHQIERIRNYEVIDRPPLKEIVMPIIPQQKVEDNFIFLNPHHTDRPWYNPHKGGNKNKRNHKK